MGVLGDKFRDKCVLNVGLPYVEGNDSKPVDFFDFPLLQFSYHRVWLLDRNPCSIVWLNSTKKRGCANMGGICQKVLVMLGASCPAWYCPAMYRILLELGQSSFGTASSMFHLCPSSKLASNSKDWSQKISKWNRVEPIWRIPSGKLT